jgi:hypothetical protein
MTTIDQQDRDTLIDTLEQYPARIQAIVADATDEQLRKAGPSGGPGAVGTVCFMRDFEELFLERLTRMIEEDDPRLTRVEDSLWPIERDYVNQDPLETLHDFIDYRRQVVELLEDLPINAWERTGHHPSLGQFTVRQYAERVLERDRDLERQLLAALGRGGDGRPEPPASEPEGA